jgi:hypothetical protein
MVRRPDIIAVIDKAKPPTPDNIKAIIEMKSPGDPVDKDQIFNYKKIAGEDTPVLNLTLKACKSG